MEALRIQLHSFLTHPDFFPEISLNIIFHFFYFTVAFAFVDSLLLQKRQITIITKLLLLPNYCYYQITIITKSILLPNYYYYQITIITK